VQQLFNLIQALKSWKKREKKNTNTCPKTKNRKIHRYTSTVNQIQIYTPRYIQVSVRPWVLVLTMAICVHILIL